MVVLNRELQIRSEKNLIPYGFEPATVGTAVPYSDRMSHVGSGDKQSLTSIFLASPQRDPSRDLTGGLKRDYGAA